MIHTDPSFNPMDLFSKSKSPPLSHEFNSIRIVSSELLSLWGKHSSIPLRIRLHELIRLNLLYNVKFFLKKSVSGWFSFTDNGVSVSRPTPCNHIQ